VNDDCEKLKDILFEIQRKFVPVVKGKRKNKKLWLTYKALKHVESKHRVFRKYKDSRHPVCKRESAKATRAIKKAKYNLKENWLKISRATLNLFLHMFGVGRMLQRSWDH